MIAMTATGNLRMPDLMRDEWQKREISPPTCNVPWTHASYMPFSAVLSLHDRVTP
jgi:hypothetical protein